MKARLKRCAPVARTIGLVLVYTALIVGCVLFAPEQNIPFIYTEF